MAFTRSAWLLLMLNAMITQATARQCYLPNGLAAENATPFSMQHEHSPCCGSDSLRLANGLCLNQHATDSRALLYVGGCTDPSMQHAACPSYCKTVDLGASSLPAIVPCSDGTWCCSAANSDGTGDTSCCRNSAQTFPLDWSSLLPSPPNAAAMQPLSRRDSDSSTTTYTTIPLRADDTDSTDANKARCPSDRSTIVGISTGVPLGACLLAALAAIFVLLNRDRAARARIRTMAETAREDRERAAQEHMLPRLYHASLSASSSPALGSSTNINTLSRSRFSSGSPVVGPAGFYQPSPIAPSPVQRPLSPPPQTPQHPQHHQLQQYGLQPYDPGAGAGGYDNGGGGGGGAGSVTSGGGGAGVPGGLSGGGAAGTHLSWTTSCEGGERESEWAYEYEGPEARKERFEMTP